MSNTFFLVCLAGLIAGGVGFLPAKKWQVVLADIVASLLLGTLAYMLYEQHSEYWLPLVICAVGFSAADLLFRKGVRELYKPR